MMILVSGYYGFNNAGDEGILAALCNDLITCGVKKDQITVLSADPEKTTKLHGVKAIPRYNTVAIYLAMRKCKVFISGGGSLLQDSTSWRTVPYYLGIIKMALYFGTKVLIYGQGIGPVASKKYKHQIGKTLQRVDGITVRDQYSANLLAEWGVPVELLSVTADPVFSLPITQNHQPGITLNLRPYPNFIKDLPGWISIIRSWINDHQWQVSFVPLGPGDLAMGESLQNQINQLQIVIPTDWQQASQAISKNKYVISMRLHGVIFAAIGKSLPIGLAYDPKVQAIATQLQIMTREIKPTSQLTLDLLTLQQNQSDYSSRVEKQVELLSALSNKNRAMLGKHIFQLALEDNNES